MPLFEVVYHDYTIGFGQYIYTRELDNIKFKDAIEGKCARQFSFGSQFAWSRIPLLAIMEKLPEAAAFIKTLAHAKHQHSDYLTRGKMLRPLKLDVPQLTQHWSKTYYDEEGEDITLPAVLNSIWIKNDTSIAVVLVNISEQPETIIVNLAANPEDYPLPQGGVVRVYDHLGESISKFVAQGDSDKFTVTVEPKHVIVATFGSEKPYGVHCVDPGTLNSDVDINRVMI